MVTQIAVVTYVSAVCLCVHVGCVVFLAGVGALPQEKSKLTDEQEKL